MAGDKLLDQAGLHILRALQENARISFSDLAKQTGLSSPAISERVRRMEAAGYIKGYRAIVDYEKLGYPITAFIRISLQPDRADEADETARSMSGVLEGYHPTGTDSLILKVAASSVGDLENMINMMGSYGQTTTSIILSEPVASRTLLPPQETKSPKRQKTK